MTILRSKLLENSAPLGGDLYNAGTVSVDSGSSIGDRYNG
jgi:hypothetical protein